MLGKRSRPLIKKLSDCPMNRPSDIMNNMSSSNTNTNSRSPRSPLDFRIPLSLSPVASKNNNLKCSYNDHVAGVGLGIIIAGLENSNSKVKAKSDSGDKILVKYALRSPSPAVRSGPVPVKSSGRTSCCVNEFMRERGVVTEKDPGAVEDQEDEEEEDENYTFVTCRSGPNKANVTTRVYYGGGDHQPKKKNTTTTVISSSKFKNSTDYVVVATQKQNGGVFRISSAFGGEEDEDFDKAVESTCSDFLNNCNMCRKTLLGKDIFMYRGEKAFCSEECRQRQMVRDERKENKFCRSEAPATATTPSSSSRAKNNTTDVVLSGSPYHNYDRAQIFSAGIVAV